MSKVDLHFSAINTCLRHTLWRLPNEYTLFKLDISFSEDYVAVTYRSDTFGHSTSDILLRKLTLDRQILPVSLLILSFTHQFPIQ